MKRAFTRSLLGLALAALTVATPALADRDVRGGGRHDRGHEFRSPHWVFDDRFHHDHYYPRVGYSLAILPPGYLDIRYRDRHFYFDAGVWFVRSGAGYVVAMPPAGVVVPILPPAYTTVWIGGVPYYYANRIYYTTAPDGYVTVAPPAGDEDAAVAPPPPPTPSSSRPVAPASDLLFITPLNRQSGAQMSKDRAQCSYWASGKSGYDPAASPADDPRRGDYLRDVASCLESRGYAIK